MAANSKSVATQRVAAHTGPRFSLHMDRQERRSCIRTEAKIRCWQKWHRRDTSKTTLGAANSDDGDCWLYAHAGVAGRRPVAGLIAETINSSFRRLAFSMAERLPIISALLRRSLITARPLVLHLLHDPYATFQWSWDNTDVRYANTATVAGWTLFLALPPIIIRPFKTHGIRRQPGLSLRGVKYSAGPATATLIDGALDPDMWPALAAMRSSITCCIWN